MGGIGLRPDQYPLNDATIASPGWHPSRKGEREKEMDDRERAIAIYKVRKTGKEYALMPTVSSGFYELTLDYDGMFLWGATRSMTPFCVKLLALDTKEELIEWTKTPGNIYHCWHICTCERCSPKVSGSIYQEQGSGKIFSHSQGDWNEHLKYVDNDNIFTFPTAKVAIS